LKTFTDCYRKVVTIRNWLMQVISELSKVQLYSAAIDSQSLQTCLDSVSREYPELRPDVLDGLIKKVNSITTTIGTFIQLVNDFDQTIERASIPPS
jgi:hypothetical protein